MKRLVLCFLALSLWVPLVAYSATLSLATLNCEFLTRPKVHIKFGHDFDITKEPADVQAQWEVAGYRDQKFSEAAMAVAQVIHSIDADVIALTEVGDEKDVLELKAQVEDQGLAYPYVAIGASVDSRTRQNVALFSKFPLTNVLRKIPGREHYLKEPDDPDTEDDTGLSKGMKAAVTAHGHEFVVYVLHLASESGGHEKDAQRIAQASVARRHYLPEIKQGHGVVVAGDLNDRRGQPAINRIRGLDDIHEDLIQTGYSRYFDKDKLGTRWTYEYNGERNQIDHILLSHAVKDITVRSDGIRTRTLAHGNPLVSDHQALIVSLTLLE